MKNFTMSIAQIRQNPRNVMFRESVTITDLASLIEASKWDHVGAILKDGHRGNADFISSDVVIMDCDNDNDDAATWITPEDLADELAGVAFMVVYSRNNMKPKGGKSPRPRFHVYFPVNYIEDAAEYAQLKADILKICPFFDPNAIDVSRQIFGVEAPEVKAFNDNEEAITIDEFVKNNLPASQSDPANETAIAKYTGGVPALSSGEVIPEGMRNSTLFNKAVRLMCRYGIGAKAHNIFYSLVDRCDPPLDEEEVHQIWRNAVPYAKEIMNQEGYIPPEEFNVTECSYKPIDYTDVGQAKLYAEKYGDRVRYLDAGAFLVFNGKHWEEKNLAASAFARQLTDKQMREAEKIIEGSIRIASRGNIPLEYLRNKKKGLDVLPSPQRKIVELYRKGIEYQAYARSRRSSSALKAVVEVAKPDLQINVEELDANPYLLNTPEGTCDLRLGVESLRSHRSDDYITQITNVSPSDEGAEKWQAALELFFRGDKDLIRYTQLILGAALIGKVPYEALIIFYGEGRNGKSTFCNAIADCIGTYGGRIDSDILINACNRNIRPDLAELRGKRIVFGSEWPEGHTLNTEKLKKLCSRDAITAEKKYQAPFSFIPTHILVLMTNHLPKVSALDYGTWRRLCIIPFNAVIPANNSNVDYSKYLIDKCGGAILKWLIEGATAFLDSNGELPRPAVVEEAIAEYKGNNDWLKDFLDEYCELENTYFCKSGELYKCYREHCRSVNEFAKTQQDFNTALIRKGCIKLRTKHGYIFKGVKLKYMPSFSPVDSSITPGMEV